MTADIRAMFAAKAAEAPIQGQRDAIALFKGSIRTQIKKIEQLKKDPSTTISQTNWFKSYDGGYRLQLGKKPIEFNGAKFWQVNDLDEAQVLFEGALSLADADKELQDAIRNAKKPSADEATKPKRGRKSKS